MRSALLLLMFAVLAAGSLAAPLHAQTLYPGLTGQALIDQIRADFRPSAVLSSSASKDRMMDTVWGDASGVRGIYTGLFVPFDCNPTCDSNQDVFNNGSGLNQEHIWPRSRGVDGTLAEYDLHHLAPARVVVNGDRASLPFDDLGPSSGLRFYQGDIRTTTAPPPAQLPAYSTLYSDAFEPRDVVKGDVARAMLLRARRLRPGPRLDFQPAPRPRALERRRPAGRC